MNTRSLALALTRLRRLGGEDGPTIGQAAESFSALGRLAPLPLLAALGMTPSPGLPLGAICGGLMVWLALAGLLQRPVTALPQGMARRRIPPGVLRVMLRQIAPPLRKLEKLARPRLTAATWPTLAWLAILGQGVVMALPIPLGNFLPGVAVLVLSIAVLRRDGLGVLLGLTISALSLAVLAGLGWSLMAVF
ncbi:MAG: exopolysaccharide biosynthesis protein [Magnetospirillum gryphiswaldense]|nr:exopolysaccharide biosynthesis protein [Magnetospirillum gryphiswaldense]